MTDLSKLSEEFKSALQIEPQLGFPSISISKPTGLESSLSLPTVAEIEPLLNESFSKPPMAYPGLFREDTPLGYSVFQNFINCELPKMKEVYLKRRTCFRMSFPEASKNYDGEYNSLVNDIVGFYESNKKKFKKERYSILRMIEGRYGKSTTADSGSKCEKSETSSAPSEKQMSGQLKPENEDHKFIMLISEILLFVQTHVNTIKERLAKQIAQAKVASPEELHKNLLLFFKDLNQTKDNFFLSSLEINHHLNYINIVMSQVTSKLGLQRKDLPEFAIWRLFFGIYRNSCYLPLAKELHEMFICELDYWRKREAKEMERLYNKPPMKEMEMDLDFELSDDMDCQPMETIPSIYFAEQFDTLKETLNGFLDFNLNEYSVLFIDHIYICDLLDTNISWLLQQIIQVITPKFFEELAGNGVGIELIDHDQHVMGTVVPRGILRQLEAIQLKATSELYKKIINKQSTEKKEISVELNNKYEKVLKRKAFVESNQLDVEDMNIEIKMKGLGLPLDTKTETKEDPTNYRARYNFMGIPLEKLDK